MRPTKPILRIIEIPSGQSFSVSEHIHPYLYNHWHYHPEIELTYIRKGSGLRLVGDHMESFEDGDLILLGPNLLHFWRSDDIYFQPGSTLQMEAVAIHFNEHFWGNQFHYLPELDSIRKLLIAARQGLRVTGAAQAALAPMMEAMLNASEASRIANLINMLDCIAQSGCYTQLASLGFTCQYEPGRIDKINEIYNYTLTHFKEKINISDVAAEVHMSQHSFCRFFKTHTNKTWGEVLMELRIGHACRLLIDNNQPIGAIADSCGFSNLSNFNRQFKHHTQKSPLQYRKEHIKSIN